MTDRLVAPTRRTVLSTGRPRLPLAWPLASAAQPVPVDTPLPFRSMDGPALLPNRFCVIWMRCRLAALSICTPAPVPAELPEASKVLPCTSVAPDVVLPALPVPLANERALPRLSVNSLPTIWWPAPVPDGVKKRRP